MAGQKYVCYITCFNAYLTRIVLVIRVCILCTFLCRFLYTVLYFYVLSSK